MHIRQATEADFNKCISITDKPDIFYIERFEEIERNTMLNDYIKSGIFFVAEEDGEVVGFVIGEFCLAEKVWLESIVVRKDLRGKGIGKLLFNAFKNHCKEKGYNALYLSSDPSAEKFYESIGMNKGKQFTEFQLDL